MIKRTRQWIITAALVLAGIAFLTAGLCVWTAEKNDFPPAGIYFAQHLHYTGWTDPAYNPYFTLQVYEVRGGDSFLDYKDISLQGENGNRFALKDASIRTIFYDSYFASYRLLCVVDRNDFSEGETVFTNAILERADGGEQTFSIGRVVVLIGTQSDNKISFSGGTSSGNELNSYNVKVTNGGDSSVVIESLSFNLTEITAQYGYYDADNRFHEFGDSVRLGAGESIILNCAFSGNDVFRATPYCEFKPLINYRTSEGVKSISVTNSTSYFAAMGRAEIKDYLRGVHERATV